MDDLLNLMQDPDVARFVTTCIVVTVLLDLLTPFVSKSDRIQHGQEIMEQLMGMVYEATED